MSGYQKDKNKTVLFDPFALAAASLGEEKAHALVRWVMILVCLAFLIQRATQYNQFFFKPLWFLETILFAVLALSYFKRMNPVKRARGFVKIVLPLVGGLLPFFILISDPNAAIWRNQTARLSLLGWMTLSTTLTVWGMWTLREAFSITVEARKVVMAGPYRFIRHPIYLGEILATAGVALLRLSTLSAALFVTFVTVQLVRSRLEEATLAGAFPQYRKNLKGRFWFWRL